MDITEKHGATLAYCPLAALTASLLYPPEETGGDRIGNGNLALALHRMGEHLQLAHPSDADGKEKPQSKSIREIIADRDPNFWLPATEGPQKAWREIVELFASALDGCEIRKNSDGNNDGNNDDFKRIYQTVGFSPRFEHWDFEARPIVEHAICYAACKAGDTHSLCLARAICSQGVSLRRNSPEEWWRYSIVLGLLGDEVGSDDALNNSINFGAGQGASG